MPSALNGVSARGGNTRTGGGAPRRASGSETIGRRVLADIEWWRVDANPGAVDVMDGVDENLATIPNEPQAAQDTQTEDAQARMQPAVGFAPGGDSHIVATTAQFAALSITPHTPARRRGQDGSFSSVESTPERRDRDDDVDMTDGTSTEPEDSLPMPFVLPPAPERAARAPILVARAHSFADVFSLHHDYDEHDMDDPFVLDWTVSPLSSVCTQFLD
ncbi:hypothetical protein GGF50DRAFT_57314 [Schizophyllum commune]